MATDKDGYRIIDAEEAANNADWRASMELYLEGRKAELLEAAAIAAGREQIWRARVNSAESSEERAEYIGRALAWQEACRLFRAKAGEG